MQDQNCWETAIYNNSLFIDLRRNYSKTEYIVSVIAYIIAIANKSSVYVCCSAW